MNSTNGRTDGNNLFVNLRANPPEISFNSGFENNGRKLFNTVDSPYLNSIVAHVIPNAQPRRGQDLTQRSNRSKSAAKYASNRNTNPYFVCGE
jgi:hypothetical protein